MRFMVLVKADKDSEAGVLPDEKMLTDMGNFNDELMKAGMLLAGEGLHPTSKGKRVRFSGATRTVIDGPFPETKELVAGFWILQAEVDGRGGRLDQACADRRRIPRSRSARSSKRRTSVPSSRPSFARRRSANARSRSSCSRLPSTSRSGRCKGAFASPARTLSPVVDAPSIP